MMARSRGQSFRKGRRKGFRRQFGLDRSGPPPRQTRPGEPLRPWTIPNAVGYLRLAGLPVFLYLAFSSGDGRDPWAAAIFWLKVRAGWSEYAPRSPAEEPLGKKEAAERDALTAGEGNEWGRLVN